MKSLNFKRIKFFLRTLDKCLIVWAATALAFVPNLSHSQVIIADLNFTLVQDEGINNGNFDIKIQIRNNENSQPDYFGLGSSNVRFRYDSAAICNPILISTNEILDEGTDPNGSVYDSMFINQPVNGKICGLNVILLEGPGFDIEESWVDMATIRFTIVNSSQTEKLFWRNDSIVPLTFIQTGASDYLYCYLGLLNYYIPGVWRGFYSSDWFSSDNWSDIVVPNSLKDIYIPADTPYEAVVYPGVTAHCRDLNLLDSAKITLQHSSTLIIHGNANIISSDSITK